MQSAPVDIDGFIARWKNNTGGAERANYGMFLTEFCTQIGVGQPDPAEGAGLNDRYRFEHPVKFRDGGELAGHGRIDLYKKGCFVLEAKQSRWKDGKKAIAGQSDLFTAETDKARTGTADRNWDVLMMNARRQAEDYAKALPPSDGWPPFILVCDVGYCFELYADFTGQGKNYAQFPDRRGFRVFLDDLRKPEVRAMFRAIWEDPKSLDPTAKAVAASRRIAARLAEVSKRLEAKKVNGKPAHDPEEIAAFLMRCLFTMFAEDMDLLPKDSFTNMLEDCRKNPAIFVPLLTELWRAMDKGSPFFAGLRSMVRRFNGNLFKSAKVFALEAEDIGELKAAAEADWTQVDPSIFGTLLEQALDPATRSRLGAHYTPRTYVERLVTATVMEPLQADWQAVRGTATRLTMEGQKDKAIDLVREFHEKLFNTRVLDPACGTGNFLYVALEMMKRMEGEVLEALIDLGGEEALRGLDRHEVDPHQFFGLELNHRARHIAELVLWIGFLQWHKRNRGGLPSDPVLRDYGNIRQGDAVLKWDGQPNVAVVDGKESLPNPRRPDWPEAEFIVGNPPFIGGKDIRSNLGDVYTEALWKAHPQMNDSADFVMYWWDRAAELLTRKGAKLRRFGFVTTNSITQVFQRKVVERHLSAKQPVSLVMAIGDHPWTKATDGSAAVRIAMTVAEAGTRDGVLHEVMREAALDTDAPVVEMETREGRINVDLTVGVDVASTSSLMSNCGICSRGMALHGAGFLVSASEAVHLGLNRYPNLSKHLRPYRNGRDLNNHSRNLWVIDLDGLTDVEVRQSYPEVFQLLLTRVKPERDANREQYRRENWWLFGRKNAVLRPALACLPRYIATVETAKHRIFSFLDAEILPDNMLVAFASADAFHLGVLSSNIHSRIWMPANAASLGVFIGNVRYSKSRCFDPFPFPETDEFTCAAIAAIAEEIDAHRKRAQAAHGIALTQMYNVLERLKAVESADGLSPEEHDIWQRALIGTLKHLHERLDDAVARAYGWPADLAEQEVLARLVALNKQRAAEERAGQVRWLRPEYQIPRFGSAADKAELELVGGEGEGMAEEAAKKPTFPKSDVEQTIAITLALARAAGPVSAEALSREFSQGRKAKDRIDYTLRALSRMGELYTADGEHFQLRRVA